MVIHPSQELPSSARGFDDTHHPDAQGDNVTLAQSAGSGHSPPPGLQPSNLPRRAHDLLGSVAPISGSNVSPQHAAPANGQGIPREESLDLDGGVDNDEGDVEGNPWSKLFIPDRHLFSEPTARDRAFTFLNSNNVAVLRAIAKDHSVRHYGVKNTLICNLMLQGQTTIAGGVVDWSTVFGDKKTDFWGNTSNQTLTVLVCPNQETILAHEPQLNTRQGSRPASIIPNMASFEFARLIAILTEKEEARRALIASGQDLSRIQLQRRESRDDFWSSIVAVVFNDSLVTLTLNLAGCMDDDSEIRSIDVNGAPLAVRAGAWLKDLFFSVRSAFTKVYQKWSTSGQNNPEGHDFYKYVHRAVNSTGISSIGRCACIMFTAMKCSSLTPDLEIFNFVCRLAPNGAGYDDDEESRGDSMRGGSVRKKRKILERIQNDVQKRNSSIESLTDSVRTMASSMAEVVNSTNERRSSQNDSSLRLLESMASLTKQRAEIVAVGGGGELNSVSKTTITLIDKKLEIMQRECSALLNSVN